MFRLFVTTQVSGHVLNDMLMVPFPHRKISMPAMCIASGREMRSGKPNDKAFKRSRSIKICQFGLQLLEPRGKQAVVCLGLTLLIGLSFQYRSRVILTR
jgi:hypothetical protein